MRYIYKKAETLDGEMALVQMTLPKSSTVYVDLGVDDEAYRTDAALVTNIWTYDGAQIDVAASLWDSDPIYEKNSMTTIHDPNFDEWGGIHFTLTPESTQSVFVITAKDQYAPISDKLKTILEQYPSEYENDQISELYDKMDQLMDNHKDTIMETYLEKIDNANDDETRQYYGEQLINAMTKYNPSRVDKFHLLQEQEAERLNYNLHPEYDLLAGLTELSSINIQNL